MHQHYAERVETLLQECESAKMKILPAVTPQKIEQLANQVK